MKPIDGEQLEEIIYKFYCKNCREKGLDRCRGCKVTNILGFMKKLCNKVEAKPVVQAHWEYHGGDDDMELYGFCSHCGKGRLTEDDILRLEPLLCPYCGAQMDEFASDNNVGSKTEGVKIPVISMEDVPKIMEENK